MSTEIANVNIKGEKFANSNTKLEEKIGLITGGNSASARKGLRRGFIDSYGPIVPFILFFDRLDTDMQKQSRRHTGLTKTDLDVLRVAFDRLTGPREDEPCVVSAS
jgi:hypothetical protein